jgi:hypothetical protein
MGRLGGANRKKSVADRPNKNDGDDKRRSVKLGDS